MDENSSSAEDLLRFEISQRSKSSNHLLAQSQVANSSILEIQALETTLSAMRSQLSKMNSRIDQLRAENSKLMWT
jgi:TolA-binding protein